VFFHPPPPRHGPNVNNWALLFFSAWEGSPHPSTSGPRPPLVKRTFNQNDPFFLNTTFLFGLNNPPPNFFFIPFSLFSPFLPPPQFLQDNHLGLAIFFESFPFFFFVGEKVASLLSPPFSLSFRDPLWIPPFQ